MKKGTTWRQLNQGDRDRIQLLFERGYLRKEIAVIIGVHSSRITREINGRKKKDGRYDATLAQIKAGVKRGNSKYQGMKIEEDVDLKNFIIGELEQYRSPDEIAGRMRREKKNPRISTDAIYRWLHSSFGQQYCKYLCTKRSWRKRKSIGTKRHMIPNMTRIHDIPVSVLKKGVVSEGDTFFPPKNANTKTSAVLVAERSSKYIQGNKIPSLETKHMKRSIGRMQRIIESDALILDRGVENRSPQHFGVSAYFCDPQSPHQKPLVEGSIGLLRRWFWKKGTNFDKVSDKEFQEKINIINHKYRKSLRYRSAYEVARKSGILKVLEKKIAIRPRI